MRPSSGIAVAEETNTFLVVFETNGETTFELAHRFF